MEHTVKGRFPKLNQTKSKQVLSFYHDCMLRVFDNHASRKSEYLGNVLLSTARSGDLPKLCKALEKVDLNKVDFNARERHTENTPLMIAGEHGHDQIISILLSCGSDVTLRNAAGRTVLERAPERITELILDAVNRPGAGQPLLCQAAWQGNATVVKNILHLNPNLNVNNKNAEGLTPLLLVTRDLDLFDKIKVNVFTENYNPTEVVALLLHQNADCNVVDNEGRGALHLTARHHGTNARNIISLLARKDSLNVDLRDTQEYSALHCASETGDPNILLALIDSGADVNARGPLGRTPLHMTASRGDEQTSGVLVEYGANVLLVDDLGFTPIDVAKGNNVQMLLKEAWTEHSQRSVDSLRIKSAPVFFPMVKLDHLDAPDVVNFEDESDESSTKTSKKNGKKLQGRSHSEEQTQPLTSSGMPRRTRSYSSGPSPRSKLDPVNQDTNQRQSAERISPLPQKTNRLNKSPQTEGIPRPIAKVAVLNIDLKDFHNHKSKSCSELPFTRYRVQKLSNPRASAEALAEPLGNPLSLRGRSVSAVSLSSYETLPGITSVDEVDVGEDERPSAPVSSPELQIVLTPTSDVNSDLASDERTSPDTDILNKTFNSDEKPKFWFPIVQHATSNPTQTEQNSDRAFFVDLKNLETPLQKCTKCGEGFKPEDCKSGASVCTLCYKASVEKNSFWVSFDRKVKTGPRSAGVDDRTVCIDSETLNVLRKKKMSEGSMGSEKCSKVSMEEENSPRSKQRLKKTMSDTTDARKSFGRINGGSVDQGQAECSSRNAAESRNSFGAANAIREQGKDPRINSRNTPERDDSINTTRSSEEKVLNESAEKLRDKRGISQGGYLEQQQTPKQEENKLDVSLVGQEESEQRTTESSLGKKPRAVVQLDTEETSSFTAEKGSDKLGLVATENLNESQNINVDEIISEEKTSEQCKDTQQKKHSPNVNNSSNHIYSSKVVTEFEKSRQSMQCLIEDMTCLETSNSCTDIIGRFYNRSMNSNKETFSPEDDPKKTRQSMLRGISSCAKQQPVTQKLEHVAQVSEEDECCGTTMDKTDKLGVHNEQVNSCHSNPQLTSESSEGAIVETVEHGESSGIVMDKLDCVRIQTDHIGCSGIVMDKRDHLEIPIELVDPDVTQNQVVIVNPFPTPEPPKEVPVVNVTSTCQCDRFALLAKNSGTGVKKKGRGKKTGTGIQNTEANAQKIGGKAKKASAKKEKGQENVKEKQTKRVFSAGKKGKKKFKNAQNDNVVVKEISVVQPNLKLDTCEEDKSASRNTCLSEDILRTGIDSAPVRQATFVKQKFSALSPIPEASRSGSSVHESAFDVLPSDPEHTNSITSKTGSGIDVINTDIETEAPQISEHNSDDSRSANSELFENVPEIDDNLEDLIQEILDETDELEKDHAKSQTKTRAHELITPDKSTDANTRVDKPEMLEKSKNSVDINYQTKETFVSTWLLGQHLNFPGYNGDSSDDLPILSGHKLASFCNSSDSFCNSSDDYRDSSKDYRNPSERISSEPNSSEFLVATDTNTTDSSYGSSSTPRAATVDISSDCSTVSDDTLESTTGRDDVMSESKLGTSSETTSKNSTITDEFATVFDEKQIVFESQSEHWTTSSVAISVSDRRRKSEVSGTGLEMTSSEEEEIVWRKGNMLGKGAFGKVWLGLTNTGQMIAVKQVELITSDMDEAERQYEKLQEEVALLKSLRHENVVSYLGTCLDGGVVNIFMQFVPGGSIASILARFGPLEERVFRYYTKQILVGVEYLHRNHVVHRDIKGGNIMLMPTGVIKLIDFGCAKRLYMNMSQSQGDLLRSMKGTPYWMAPEVIKETGYGRKSDIWSIGCTVFEMSTGKPPWSHLPPMSAILAIGQGSEPPKLGKPNSDDACDFVLISMARHPDDRWSAEDLLGHPFILQCDGQR